MQNKHPDSKFRDGNLRIKCNVFVFFVCLFPLPFACTFPMILGTFAQELWIGLYSGLKCYVKTTKTALKKTSSNLGMALRTVNSLTYKLQWFALGLVTVVSYVYG